jgi:hypothetical protein
VSNFSNVVHYCEENGEQNAEEENAKCSALLTTKCSALLRKRRQFFFAV